MPEMQHVPMHVDLHSKQFNPGLNTFTMAAGAPVQLDDYPPLTAVDLAEAIAGADVMCDIENEALIWLHSNGAFRHMKGVERWKTKWEYVF